MRLEPGVYSERQQVFVRKIEDILLHLGWALKRYGGCDSWAQAIAINWQGILFGFRLSSDKNWVCVKGLLPPNKSERIYRLPNDFWIESINCDFRTGALPIAQEIERRLLPDQITRWEAALEFLKLDNENNV